MTMVTLAQAAQMLRVSMATVRRRVKAGTLTAQKIDGLNGPEYRVTLSSIDEQGTLLTPISAHRGQRQGTQSEHPKQQTLNVDSLVALVRDLQQQNIELAGRVGFYQAQTETLREQLALSAPAAPMADETPMRDAPPMQQQPKRRRWWPFGC